MKQLLAVSPSTIRHYIGCWENEALFMMFAVIKPEECSQFTVHGVHSVMSRTFQLVVAAAALIATELVFTVVDTS